MTYQQYVEKCKKEGKFPFTKEQAFLDGYALGYGDVPGWLKPDVEGRKDAISN